MRDGSLLWIMVHVLQPDWLCVARYGEPHVAMRSICYECDFSVLRGVELGRRVAWE